MDTIPATNLSTTFREHVDERRDDKGRMMIVNCVYRYQATSIGVRSVGYFAHEAHFDGRIANLSAIFLSRRY